MRVVFTGGPCAGKTSVIDELRNYDYKIIEEPARQLIELYQTHYPEYMGEGFSSFRQDRIEELAVKQHMQNPVGVFDRSLVDELGYRKTNGIEITDGLLKRIRECRYDKIFVFPPWEEIYQNDAVRFESFDVALQIHMNLVEGYLDSGYGNRIVDVPKMPVIERAHFIHDILND